MKTWSVAPDWWGILWSAEAILDDHGRTIPIAAFDWSRGDVILRKCDS